MAKVLITGGTGLIGKHLTKQLLSKKHEVVILSRNPKNNNEFRWNITENYIDENAFKNITHIIHLAGAGIADKRWTPKRKKELIDSRVQSAKLLFNKIVEYKIPLRGFISASGIGYYGAITSNRIFTETDEPYSDFIAKICTEWETSAMQFKKLNIPVTILRTGIVLAKNGGALQKMNTPLFLSALGNGKQFMPWIHINDLSNLYTKAIEDTNFNGIYNAVAPQHQTNKSFTKTFGKTIKKVVLPINVPSFVLILVLGELADILVKGSRISAKKIAKNYNFTFDNLATALQNIYEY